MVSSLLHPNSSHFLNLLTLIFWPNLSHFIISILFCTNCTSTQNHFISTRNHFKSTQNHPKSTRNHSKSVLIITKHIKNLKSIIIYPILGIFVAFSVLETYQPINLIDLTLVLSWLLVLDQTIIHVIQSLTLLRLSVSDHGIINHFDNTDCVCRYYYDQHYQSISIL